MRKLTADEIRARNGREEGGRLPLAVILNNVRSLYNVGSIFRTADAVGVEKIWLCGITGAPPKLKISKTALGAENTVPWEHRSDAAQIIRELKARNYQIVLVEQIEESVPYDAFPWQVPVCLVLGNENTGISEELLELADGAVDLEMTGIKHSLNVTVAFGVVAYHVRKTLAQRASLIGRIPPRRSR
jgi:tRNA G18 (ribose-2'-O)-methylase SpoU